MLSVIVLIAGPASAADIRGTISTPLTITDDSQLVGNVTCTVTGAACITIGAPGTALRLNGFSITGQGDAVTGCGGSAVGGEHGVLVNGMRGVIIRDLASSRDSVLTESSSLAPVRECL